MVETEKPGPAVGIVASPPKRKAPNVRLPSRLGGAARMEGAEALRLLETAPSGLTETEACERLSKVGPN